MLHLSNRQRAAYQAPLPYTNDLKQRSLTYTRTQQPLNSLSDAAQHLHKVSNDDCVLPPPALPLGTVQSANYLNSLSDSEQLFLLALSRIPARFSAAILYYSLLQTALSYMHLATYNLVGHSRNQGCGSDLATSHNIVLIHTLTSFHTGYPTTQRRSLHQ